CARTPDGARTSSSSTSCASAPPTSQWVRAPVGVSAREAPTSSRSSAYSPVIAPSDPRAVGHPLELPAPASRGQDLLRVGAARWTEGAPQAGLRVEIVGREHHRHRLALLQADAVLTGQHAACLDAGREDLVARAVDPLPHTGHACVEGDEGVEVAVASME